MVDTSPEYIKMCEKAEEIQKAKLIQFGDYFTYLKKDIVFSARDDDLVGDYYKPRLWHDRGGINFGRLAIWLPQQEQLQAMIFSEIGLQTLCQAICDFSKTEYGSRFTICGSMEQLWLAFTMKEKFGKAWQDGEWKALSPSKRQRPSQG